MGRMGDLVEKSKREALRLAWANAERMEQAWNERRVNFEAVRKALSEALRLERLYQ